MSEHNDAPVPAPVDAAPSVGDADAAGLIDCAADVMALMDRLRADWGVVYPEER